MLDQPAQPQIAIETWPVDRPRPYERNARTHSPEQIEQLRNSFRTYGQVWPILVREDGTVISGHGRIEAAKAEGFETLQVIVARGWTPEQCRSFALLDNRVPLNAGWDDEMLRIEIADLTGLGIDVGALGFATRELDLLLGPIVGVVDPDDVPALPAEAVTIAGDQWVLGGHRLLCGDATSAADVLTALGGENPHLMVTDPPYGVEYDPEWRSNANRWAGSTVKLGAKAFGKVSNDDNASWAPAWKLFPGDVAYIWHGGLRCIDQAESLEQAGFVIRSQIVWNKGRLVIGRGDYHWQHECCWYAVRKGKRGHWNDSRTESTVWDIPKPMASETGHSTQKPIDCMRRPMETNSSRGDAVYEPFSGSGTSIMAAEMIGRRCLALEIDPAHVDVTVLRWQTFTGQTATLAATGQTFEEVKAQRARGAV
jgi:DNA modification methylase